MTHQVRAAVCRTLAGKTRVSLGIPLILVLSILPLQSCATIASPGPDLVPVSSEPPGARVYLDGRHVGATPLDVRVHRESEGLFTVEKDGYHAARVDRDKVLNGWFFPGALGWFFVWPVIPLSMATDLAAGNQGRYSTSPIHVVLEPEPEPYADLIETVPSSVSLGPLAPESAPGPHVPAPPVLEVLDLAPQTVAAAIQLPRQVGQIFEATFAVRRSAGEGTGVMVSTDGYAITAAHVVSGEGVVVARFRDGRTSEAEVVRVDPDRDVALIKMPLRDQEYLRFRDGNIPAIGSDVFAVSASEVLEADGTVTKGIVSGFGVRAGSRFFQTDAVSSDLHHGGPILTSDGQVLGVVSARMADAGGEGLSYCVPISEIETGLSIVLTK